MAVSKAPWTYLLSQAKAITESPSTTKGPVMEVLMNLYILLLPKRLSHVIINCELQTW